MTNRQMAMQLSRNTRDLRDVEAVVRLLRGAVSRVVDLDELVVLNSSGVRNGMPHTFQEYEAYRRLMAEDDEFAATGCVGDEWCEAEEVEAVDGDD